MANDLVLEEDASDLGLRIFSYGKKRLIVEQAPHYQSIAWKYTTKMGSVPTIKKNRRTTVPIVRGDFTVPLPYMIYMLLLPSRAGLKRAYKDRPRKLKISKGKNSWIGHAGVAFASGPIVDKKSLVYPPALPNTYTFNPCGGGQAKFRSGDLLIHVVNSVLSHYWDSRANMDGGWQRTSFWQNLLGGNHNYNAVVETFHKWEKISLDKVVEFHPGNDALYSLEDVLGTVYYE